MIFVDGCHVHDGVYVQAIDYVPDNVYIDRTPLCVHATVYINPLIFYVHGVKTLRTQDTSDPISFGTSAEVSIRHLRTHFGLDLSGFRLPPFRPCYGYRDFALTILCSYWLVFHITCIFCVVYLITCLLGPVSVATGQLHYSLSTQPAA